MAATTGSSMISSLEFARNAKADRPRPDGYVSERVLRGEDGVDLGSLVEQIANEGGDGPHPVADAGAQVDQAVTREMDIVRVNAPAQLGVGTTPVGDIPVELIVPALAERPVDIEGHTAVEARHVGQPVAAQPENDRPWRRSGLIRGQPGMLVGTAHFQSHAARQERVQVRLDPIDLRRPRIGREGKSAGGIDRADLDVRPVDAIGRGVQPQLAAQHRQLGSDFIIPQRIRAIAARNERRRRSL